jgi:hypothetical protein
MNKKEMIGDIHEKFNNIDKILIPKKLMIEGDKYHKKLKEIKKILNNDEIYEKFKRFGDLRNATHSSYEEQRAGIMLPAMLPFKLDYYIEVRVDTKQYETIHLQEVYNEFLDLYTILKEYLNTYKNE